MEFVNPAILMGVGLAAIPVVLHLIMRQQPKLLEFPALRFLQARQQSNRRRMKLRHWILLALRVLAICLLAMALARPSIRAAGMLGDSEAPTAAAMIFDTSPRMAYRHENKTRLEAAQDISRWLLPRLPAESQLAIIDANPGDPVFQIDQSTALQRIDRLDTAGPGRPVAELLEGALRLLKESPLTRKEVYIFTDLSQPAWQVDSPERLHQQLAELKGVGVYVIDVGVTDPRNLSLDELQLSGQTLARNSPLRVGTALNSEGMQGSFLVELYLSDAAGQSEKRGELTIEIAPGESKSVDLPLITGLTEGTHQGFVRFVGDDSLSIDNTRYFTVQVKPPWKVLVVASAPIDERAENFTQALAPSEFRRNGQARYEFDVASFADLPKRNVEDYAAICLLDPPAIDEDVWQRLGDFARAGGGLGIFLGPAATIAGMNTPAAQGLLPGLLDRQAFYPNGTIYLTTGEDQHPMLARFRSRRGQIPWEDFPIYRAWQFDKLHDGVGVVASLVNNRPALLERPFGKGRVVTMTTPVSELSDTSEDDRWNQLWGVGSWPFFTLTNELMLYLVGSDEGQLNYAAGQTAVLHIDPTKRFSTVLVSTPRGESLRPSPNQQNDVLVTATGTPGNYRVRAGGDTDGINLGFSANLSAEASRLNRV
ncbi:MAG TPA: BatA domain-containing protein, partial [Pirellulales bacterium]